MITTDDRFNAFFTLMEEVGVVAEKAKALPEINSRLMRMTGNGVHLIEPRELEKCGREEIWPVIYEIPRIEEMGDDCKELSIYPMFAEDVTQSNLTAYYNQRNTIAAYGAGSNVIIVNMENGETPRCMACAFIHELGHFNEAFREKRRFKKESRLLENRIAEEVRMWTLDYRLALLIGGHIYQTAAENMAKDIKRFWKKKGGRPEFSGRGIVLDKCFGPLKNPSLQKGRDGVFQRYCTFMAADRYLAPDAARATKTQSLLAGGMQWSYDAEAVLVKEFSE